MSWGVATQNGVSVSLASIVSLSCGATEFSPASLFTSGVAGAWYDPSDYSTLFQDSAGTTPVTAVEQAVRLMLDKSQGLVLGSELVTNGDFSGGTTGWTAGNSATLSTTGGKLSVVNGAVSLGQGRQTITTVAGKTYKLSVTFTSVSASRGYVFVGTFAGDNSRFSAGPLTTSQTVTGYFTAAGTSTYLSIGNADNSIGLEVQFDDVTVKDIAGNHALAPNDPSRPILRARYNQATYSEQVDNAAWSKGQIVLTGSWVNQLTAPDGTLTADLIRQTNVSSVHYALLNSSLPSAAGTYTCSLYVYASGYSKFSLRESGSTGAYVSFDIATVSVIDSGNVGTVTISSSSITAVPGYSGWYRAVVTYVYSTGVTPNFGYWALSPSYTTGQPASLNWAGDGTSGIYIWGAQIVTGSSAGTYQRIAAATDYATAGFLPYLYFVTDDSFGTNSIDFTATDKMSVCAGVTKLSDAATGIVVELSASLATNNGSFVAYNYGPSPVLWGFDSKGTVQAAASATTSAGPQTVVFTGASDIVGDSVSLRINGASFATSTGDQGSGNYGNYPLYIGRRANALLPFNGNFYQLVVVGKTLSASELASTEAYVNSKTGAY